MYLDLLLLIFALSFAIIGMWRGFLHQAISLIGILCIVFFSFPLAEQLHQSNSVWLQRSPLLVLWAISAFGLFLFFVLLRWAVSRFVGWSPMGSIDRWMGLLLGTLKGVVVGLLIGMALQVLFDESESLSADLHQDMQESHFVVASSDLMSIGLFGLSDAMEILRTQIRPRSKSFRELPLPWSEE